MNTRLGFFPYEAMNYKAAQAWLDRRADRGWALMHVYLGCIARFKRQERPKHFVDLDIRGFDESTDPDYLQLCSDAGWELVQQLRGMLLFRAAPGKSPAPIQTDGEIEWERFWKKYHPRVWSSLIALAAIGLLIFVLSLPSSRNFISWAALDSGLVLLLYWATGLAGSVLAAARSRWYLARCRRAGRVEDPGPLTTLIDSASRLHAPLFSLLFLLAMAGTAIRGPTVELAWASYSEDRTATVAACREWPVVTALDLGLSEGDDTRDTRHLDGGRSVLMEFLQYQELSHGTGPDQPLCRLTTERYECLNEAFAGLILSLRRSETQRGGFLWGALEWEPAPGLGFDESYTCREGSYLLFRQGKVVALVGCSDLDLTTAQGLSVVRGRILDEET